MSAVGPFSFLVDDGVKDITNDAGLKTYIETNGHCVCKDHPTGDGFIAPDAGVKTLKECSDLCIADTTCGFFLHSAT